MKLHLLVTGFLCWVMAVGEVSAVQYYVSPQSPQADDANPGTEAAPLMTLGKACELAYQPGIRRGDSLGFEPVEYAG